MRSEADSGVLHAINTGFVGKPKDGDPWGSYVMLTTDPGRLAAHEGIEAEMIRFAYDAERAAEAIGQSVSSPGVCRHAETGSLSRKIRVANRQFYGFQG